MWRFHSHKTFPLPFQVIRTFFNLNNKIDLIFSRNKLHIRKILSLHWNLSYSLYYHVDSVQEFMTRGHLRYEFYSCSLINVFPAGQIFTAVSYIMILLSSDSYESWRIIILYELSLRFLSASQPQGDVMLQKSHGLPDTTSSPSNPSQN